MSEENVKIPSPINVFSHLQRKPVNTSDLETKTEAELMNPAPYNFIDKATGLQGIPSPRVEPEGTATSANLLVQRLRARPRTDYVSYYKPSDNWMGSATGQGERPDIMDLAAIGQCRVGVAWMASAGMAYDSVRNWHNFCDPDTLKIIRNDTTKAIQKWAVKTDLKTQWAIYLRWERVFGTAFMVKYYSANEDRSKPAPDKPPKKFHAFSPRYMTPTNLTESNELDYNKDLWDFSGGIFTDYSIHRSRVEVLSTRPEEGSWLGLSIFEPVWMSLMGYMQNFIYIVKAFRNWGEQVPVYRLASKVKPGEVTDVLNLMAEYEAHRRWAIGKDEDLQFIQTQIGKGIQEAQEQYKEDMSSCWRVPLNQLFGRSVGGGLQGAGALVSKEDYLQEISNIEMSTSDPLMDVYEQAGFDIEGLGILWNLAVKKTDEQRLREEGMEWQNKILKQQHDNQKIQNKILELQYKQMQLQTVMGLTNQSGQPGTAGPGNSPGQNQPNENEENQDEGEQASPEYSDFSQAYWRSIRIDNRIEMPYK